ncbi:exported hypothetical protein [Cupriavidus taiwanensis]|nr:exported hypothetical protein [Cupriavidus taiwanensis]
MCRRFDSVPGHQNRKSPALAAGLFCIGRPVSVAAVPPALAPTRRNTQSRSKNLLLGSRSMSL